jgi:superfamily I DNA/RNA helicase
MIPLILKEFLELPDVKPVVAGQDSIGEYTQKKDNRFIITGAPGTGKTRLLVELINYLVSGNKMEPSRILVFCFNRKWAKIIRETTAGEIKKSFFEVPVTTFFSFCADFLNRNNNAAGNIEILNAPRQWKILKDVITGNLDFKNYPITCKYISSGDSLMRSFIQEVFDFILRAQENLMTPGDILGRFTSGSNQLETELAGIYLHYSGYLEKNGFYNYGRLLTDTVNILSADSEAGQSVRKKYDIVIVDDFAETNLAQNEIIKLVSGKNKVIYFGNENESIFSFRGSAPDNLSSVFSEINRNGKNILVLEKNFRNASCINDLCNEFISLKSIQNKTCLLTGKTPDGHCEKGSVCLKEFENSIDEINFVCSRVRRLITYGEVKPEDICILVKGLSYKTKLLESVLNRYGISYSKRSSRSVLDNRYVRYLVGLTRLIIMAGKLEVNDLNSCNSEDRSKKIREINGFFISILMSGFLKINPVPVINKISDNDSEYVFGEKSQIYIRENSPELYDFIKALEAFYSCRDLSAYNFLFRLFSDEKIKIFEHIFQKSDAGFSGKAGILKIIGDFLKAAGDFDDAGSSGERTGIESFISYIEDLSDSNFLEEIEESAGEVTIPGNVNILSFHQSKGLEFDAVFIPFVNRTYLPSVFAGSQLYDFQFFNRMRKEKILPEETIRKMHLEGERKLFYVGLSRARKHLCVTACLSEEKSIFFEDLGRITKKIKNCSEEEESVKVLNTDNLLEMTNNKWLARRRALVDTYRIQNGKYIKSVDYLKLVLFLKDFYPSENWWINRTPTVNKNNPYKFFESGYSYTSLDAYDKCPRKYMYRYFFRLMEPVNLTLEIGKLYHEILKKFYEPTTASNLESMLEIVRNETEKLEIDFIFLKKGILRDALKNFENYYRQYAEGDRFNGLSEKNFSFNLGRDRINGRIDQIKFINDDNAEMIDFKSGSKNLSAESAKKDIQLPVYRLAVNLSRDLDMLKGKEISMKYIFLGDKNCSQVIFNDHMFDYKNFSAEITGIIKRIKNEEFGADPVSSYECSNCSFRINCDDRK